MARKAIKTEVQKFNDLLKKVKYKKYCTIEEMTRALYLKYSYSGSEGIQYLKEWLQIDNMLEMLAKCDPDIKVLWTGLQALKCPQWLPDEYKQLFKGVDLKDADTKKYCLTLAVRDLLLNAIEYEDSNNLSEENEIPVQEKEGA